MSTQSQYVSQLQFEDDSFRPVDADGNAIMPEGVRYEWVHAFYVDIYTMAQYNCNAHTLQAMVAVVADSAPPEAISYRYNEQRIVMQTSHDDFQTVDATYYGATNGVGFRWQEGLTAWDIRNRVTKNKVGRVGGGETYVTTVDGVMPNITYSGQPFQLRIGVQDRLIKGGSWITKGPYRKIKMYAPPNLAIAPPATVYANRLNTFTAAIGADYVSDFTGTSIRASNGSYSGMYYGGPLPVRNQNYPYVETGTATSNIYWYPQVWKDVTDTTEFAYKMSLKLSVPDPNDTNYSVLVYYAELTDTMYMHETDDAQYGTATVTYADPAGLWEQYGVLLRNTDSRMRTRIVLSLQYGATARVQIYPFPNGDIYSSPVLIYSGQEPKTVDYIQRIPDEGSSVTSRTKVMLGSKEISFTTFTSNVVDYYMPAFTNLSIHRCDEFGSKQDNGAYCRIEWGVAITPIVNHNGKKLTIVQPAGTTVYNPLDYYTQSGVLIVPASTENAYTIIFTVEDDLNEVQRTKTLSTAGTIMDWKYGGKGLAFGKVSEFMDTVEISPFWEFLCYKLRLGTTDLQDWMEDISIRLKALEHFLSNLASADQFEVSFWNDGTLYDRQWVLSGYDAQEPDGVPEKASTERYSWEYAGWTLVEGGSTADPDALKNITSFREIYAAYVRTTRAYNAYFYHGTDLLYEVDNVNYGSGAYYSGTNPTEEGKVFVQWLPGTGFMNGPIESQALFYKETEIEDDWATIISKCNNRTAADTYEIGQYKSVDLGELGTIQFQIVAKNTDLIGGGRKAQLTWIAMQLPNLTVPYNTNVATPVYRYVPTPSFTYLFVEGVYAALNREAGTVGRVTITGTCTRNDTITLKYRCMATGDQGIDIKVDGTTVVSGYNSTDTGTYSFSVVSGQSVSIEFIYTANEYIVYQYNFMCRCEMRAATYGTWNETGYVIDDYDRPCIERYENGTGAVGGWEHSDLRQYIQENIRPYFPAVILNGIKSVEKVSEASVSQVITSETETTDATVYRGQCKAYDDIWVPSCVEMTGGSSNYGQYDLPKYGKKSGTTKYIVGTHNGGEYWLRDSTTSYYQANYGNQDAALGYCATVYRMISSTSGIGQYDGRDSTGSYYLCLGFCT